MHQRQTSFCIAIAFYHHLLADEFRHLWRHYNTLHRNRLHFPPDPFPSNDDQSTPHFTEEQISRVYIPRLAPQRNTIDEVALLSAISSLYTGPDLTYFYRPDYSLHIPPDRYPRTTVPFAPPPQQPPFEQDTQAQPDSTIQLEPSSYTQALPPSPYTIRSASDTNMATAEGGSMPEESPRASTPQLGPASSPSALQSPTTTPSIPIASDISFADSAALSTATRPPPGFPHATVTDTIRQTARDTVAQHLRTVTEHQTKISQELSQHIRTSQEQSSKNIQDLTQQVSQLCQTLAQIPKRSFNPPPMYPPLDPPIRRPTSEFTRRSSLTNTTPLFDENEATPTTQRDRPLCQLTSINYIYTTFDVCTTHNSGTSLLPSSSQFHDAQETSPSSSTPQLAERLADALRESRESPPLNMDTFLYHPKPTKLTEADMDRFARKPLEEMTQAETYAFADQLEQYLTLDSVNPDLREEARALRSLTRYIRWQTIAKWLRLYANSASQFQYSKAFFWRYKYDNFAHECVPRSHRPPDLTESINRLTQTFIDHFNPQQQTFTRPNQNTRFRSNNYQSNNPNNNQQQNQQNQFQNNQQPQQQQSPYRPNNNNNNNNGRQRPFNTNQQRPFNNQNNQQPSTQQQANSKSTISTSSATISTTTE